MRSSSRSSPVLSLIRPSSVTPSAPASLCGGGADRRLGGGDASDGHPVRRAGDVIDPAFVEELDRVRVAAVLPADAELQVLFGLATEPGTHPDQLPHAGRVERLERGAVEHLDVDVAGEDLALDVVAAEAERGLG